MPLANDLDKLRSEMQAAVKAHWKAFLFEGILLVVLGIAAMIVPAFASLAVTIFLGWMFLISGIGGLIATFWARNMPGFWWSLISAALAGTLVVANDRRPDGYRDRFPHHRRPAGIGGLGDRPFGRPQPDVRRRDPDRDGVGGAQHLTANRGGIAFGG